MKNSRLIRTVMKILDRFDKSDMTVYAGYATLYILMSLVPLLTLLISIVKTMPWFNVEDISSFLFRLFPNLPQVEGMLKGIIDSINAQNTGLIASVSVLITLWSSSNGVSAIQAGLEKIDGVKRSRLKGKPKAVLFTVIYAMLIPFLLVLGVMREELINVLHFFLEPIGLMHIVENIIGLLQYSGLFTLAVMFAVFLVTYCHLPAGRRTAVSQIPAALFASAGCGLFTVAYSFFIGRFWQASSVYGPLASVFLTAMWLNLIITIIFYGAIIARTIKTPDA